MSGKENKDITTVSAKISSTRRSISSPFSSTSKKAASSGVRLPSPARRSITVPLISSSPSSTTLIPRLSQSISNAKSAILKEGQNIISKTHKCNIKQEAVNPDTILTVKTSGRKIEKTPLVTTNKPLKPQPLAPKPRVSVQQATKSNLPSSKEENEKTVQNNARKKDSESGYKNE